MVSRRSWRGLQKTSDNEIPATARLTDHSGRARQSSARRRTRHKSARKGLRRPTLFHCPREEASIILVREPIECFRVSRHNRHDVTAIHRYHRGQRVCPGKKICTFLKDGAGSGIDWPGNEDIAPTAADQEAHRRNRNEMDHSAIAIENRVRGHAIVLSPGPTGGTSDAG